MKQSNLLSKDQNYKNWKGKKIYLIFINNIPETEKIFFLILFKILKLTSILILNSIQFDPNQI